MALYFPSQYNSTSYRTFYDGLTPVEKIRFHREFVGVTYKRCFLHLKATHSNQSFKDNLAIAGKNLQEKMVLSWFTWRHQLIYNQILAVFKRNEPGETNGQMVEETLAVGRFDGKGFLF